MNKLSNNLRALGLTALLVAALPLAASAMSVGVSNEVDTQISSGHLCTNSVNISQSQGNEWTATSASKTEWGTESGSTTASVTDPASSNSQQNGQYVATSSATGGSAGTYSNYSETDSSVTGGVQANTSIVHTVSAFTNP